MSYKNYGNNFDPHYVQNVIMSCNNVDKTAIIREDDDKNSFYANCLKNYFMKQNNICRPTAQAAISSNLAKDLYSFVATHSATIALLRDSAWVIKILLLSSKDSEHYTSHFSFVMYTKLWIKVNNQIEDRLLKILSQPRNPIMLSYVG